MITLRRILVAVDFSDASRKALEFGRMLADASGATLGLVHVIGHPLDHPETVALDRSDGCRRLDALLDETDRQRRRATTACVVGPAAAALAAYAADSGADLLVMGTHHHGTLPQMVRGSVASAVVGLAPCAVLAVKDPAEQAAAFDPPSRAAALA